jgi:hypothetical protein
LESRLSFSRGGAPYLSGLVGSGRPLDSHNAQSGIKVYVDVYFASSKVGGIPLLILNCEVAPLTTPNLIANCVAGLVDLAQVCRARFGSYLYTTKFLAAEVELHTS